MNPSNPRRGLLVAIEGIDGAGKSVVLERLAAYCRENQISHVTSREPTSGPWGMKLRQSAKSGRLPLDQELALFLQDRAEHVRTLIAPALAEGKVVILDRYYLSTAAYQGARGGNPEAILAENERFAPQPDLVLLLDVDPLAGRARIHQRGGVPDTFEDLTALTTARAIFLALKRPFVCRVDAGQPADLVVQECLSKFVALLANHPEKT
jgi:dTMP kinase